MASGPITSWQLDEETMETVTDFILGGSKIRADGNCSHEIKRCLLLGRKVMTNLDNILKSRDIADKGLSNQSCGFSSSHVWMWELDHKEGWMLNNWYFWTMLLEKTLESPLDYKEIKPVNPKGNQSWIFIRRTDAETEASILWPPDSRSRLIGKDPDAEKDRRKEMGTTEDDEMVRWHPWLNGHEFEQALGNGEGQGSLACCSPCGHKESDRTDWLNSNNSNSNLLSTEFSISINILLHLKKVDSFFKYTSFHTVSSFFFISLNTVNIVCLQ